MLKQLREQIARLKTAGARYADARWYPVEETHELVMWNGNLKSAAASSPPGGERRHPSGFQEGSPP